MRLASDIDAPLGRRMLRLHIVSTTQEADLRLPEDLSGPPRTFVLLWLLLLVGLLVVLVALY